jgi:hypothetical protein
VKLRLNTETRILESKDNSRQMLEMNVEIVFSRNKTK